MIHSKTLEELAEKYAKLPLNSLHDEDEIYYNSHKIEIAEAYIAGYNQYLNSLNK